MITPSLSVAPAGSDPAITGEREPRGTAGLRLQLLLSGIALAVVAVRFLEMARLLALSGGPGWPPVAAVEGAMWLGWTLWAAALVPLARRRLDRRPRRGREIALLLFLIAAPAFVVPLVSAPVHWSVFGGSESLAAEFLHVARHNALTNLLLGATFVGVVYSYLHVQRARRLEVTAARLNTQLAHAQLETLRAQLDPHFLFNALNSIAVLARRGKVQDVEQMVGRLSGLLRHSLESSRAQLVTLRVELAALHHFLEIELVRYGDRLKAAIEVPEALQDRLVPSFLLQPLVENSIRHGFVDPQRPLSIEVRAAAEAGNLVLSVTDDGAGLAERGGTREGVGLRTTRARLAGLYGAQASLSLGPGPAGRGTRVVIQLPDGPAPAKDAEA